MRCYNKLNFPLCYKSASKDKVEECICTDEDRAFIHPFCTSENELAMKSGYDMIQVTEVLHWPDTVMYDLYTKYCDFFTSYINTFLELKQQASGFPKMSTLMKREVTISGSTTDMKDVVEKLNSEEFRFEKTVKASPSIPFLVNLGIEQT